MKKSEKSKKSDVLKSGVILEGNKFKTPIGRLSYPALFEPESFKDSKAKYKCAIIFDDSEVDLGFLKKLGKKVINEKFGDKIPKNLVTPWRDGEEREDSAGYGEGTTFMNVASDYKPLVIDRKSNKITDQTEIYAGCYVRLIVSPFVYTQPKKGLSFGLLAVQKLKDGEAFGMSVSAADFGEDDLSNFEDEEVEADIEDEEIEEDLDDGWN